MPDLTPFVRSALLINSKVDFNNKSILNRILTAAGSMG
ncbi:hypothetical protein C427_5606 [Paraglaciecola psychrophila 170]|uniref:Uncharacterized protein n=1 Tax=Paraglaciecola psychrophila 170 TaxID=1129794 RepID=K6YVY2_9ALTE|nr:hypothetical protein C427_5606 [Paraglaciecola psychrophila 170]GAC36864.1 hypothetical protein GPSY_1229 [Paraglaciecola psychrophila 170]